MMPLAWFKAAFKALVLPPTGPLLLAIAGVVLLSRKPRVGRSLAWLGLGSLMLLSIPAVSGALLDLLGTPAPFSRSDAADAKAIVVLGGGVRRNSGDYAGDTLGRLTLERVRYGARVARLTGLPVLVSGGRPTELSQSEAALMREALEGEYGVPVRWIEERSTNTHENAVMSARLLKRDGIDTVVLVAHGFDMRRAAAEFVDAGIRVVPAATHLSMPGPFSPGDFLPSPDGLQTSYYALYEIFGQLAFQVRRASNSAR